MSLDGTMMYREKRQEGAATMTQNAKIGQHFVWVMVVRCGEKSPHKPPMKGGEPTMRKGSYSEELVRVIVATKACSKRREGRISFEDSM